MVRKAVQLHSVRSLEEPLPDVLRRVAGYGYDGVEFAHRLQGADLKAVATALDETGMVPVGAHTSLWALETDLEATLDRCRSLDCQDLVVAHLPRRHFRTIDRIETLGARLDAVGSALDDRGFRLHYHNQVHDFMALSGETALGRFLVGLDRLGGPPARDGRFGGGRHRIATTIGTVGDYVFEWLYQRRIQPEPADPSSTAYGQLVAATDPSAVRFELDVGAAAAAGYDVGPLLELIGGRSSLLHLKDVAVDTPHPTNGQRSVDPGLGVVPVDRVVQAARRWDIEWVIYENEGPSDPRRILDLGADAVDDGARS